MHQVTEVMIMIDCRALLFIMMKLYYGCAVRLKSSQQGRSKGSE